MEGEQAPPLLPPVTSVPGDAAPGGWGKEFSAGACPAENDWIFLICRKQTGETDGFPWVPFLCVKKDSALRRCLF